MKHTVIINTDQCTLIAHCATRGQLQRAVTEFFDAHIKQYGPPSDEALRTAPRIRRIDHQPRLIEHERSELGQLLLDGPCQ